MKILQTEKGATERANDSTQKGGVIKREIPREYKNLVCYLLGLKNKGGILNEEIKHKEIVEELRKYRINLVYLNNMVYLDSRSSKILRSTEPPKDATMYHPFSTHDPQECLNAQGY